MNNLLASVANISSPNVNQQQLHTALAERADIHKSCKSIETLLNILNDYCEAATVVVALEKKLAKALRETASSKVTNEVAANALNASASIFDVLVDVDTKFVKIADKEYDTISTEVKKWFKKLAKEEKVHDERIANANAKIKQAGIIFEKKSKKRAGDAPEEHSKYIQLISTLGPEITQEKYNHTLQTTQRHTVTIHNIAASLSRIADTEWTRCCESIRRSAPIIGFLGEWRALCEGLWYKDVPEDLVDLDKEAEDNLKLNTIQERGENEEESKDSQGQPQRHQLEQLRQDYGNATTPLHSPIGPQGDQETHQLHNQASFNGREATTSMSTSYSSQPTSSSSGNSPVLQHNSAYDLSPTRLSPPSLTRIPGYQADGDRDASIAPTTPSDNNLHPPSPSQYRPRSREESPTNDRERLFSDPVTGSHFPLPPPRPRDPPSQKTQTISVIRESREEQTYITGERDRLSGSPLPLEVDQAQKGGENFDSSEQLQQQPRRVSGDERLLDRPHTLDIPRSSPTPGMSQGMSMSSPIHHSPVDDRNSTDTAEDHELYAREFGVREERRGSDGQVGKTSTPSMDKSSTGRDNVDFPSISTPLQGRSRLAETTDTGSSSATGSIVAAMRSRYSNTSGSQSPPPRSDVPRLQASVNELASRYQPPPPSNVHGTNTNYVGVAETRSQKSPRAQQSPLQSATRSPPAVGRRISLPPTPERAESRQRGGVSSPSMTPTPSTRPLPRESPSRPRTRDSSENTEDFVQRRRLEGELTEKEYRKKERDLMEREREILMREKELERDRARISTYRDGLVASSGNGNNSDYGDLSNSHGASPLQSYPKERRISFRRLRQNSQPKTPPMGRNQLLPPQGHLGPSSSNPNLRERHQSHHSYSSPPASSYNNPDFNTSSTSGSGSGNSAHLNRSTGSPVIDKSSLQPPSEKKGGWMRRLSMPVGGALPFSLDSSKRHVNNSGSSATSSGSPTVGVKQLGAGIVGGKGIGIMSDDRRNHSSVTMGFGGRDSRDGDREREHGYGYAQVSPGEQDGVRFGGLGNIGLGRRNHDARSTMNLKSGFNRK
ncbi:hypothetical protein AGABI1DRAFT_107287 [Agaricus bisporus var. burnettii JB137-S8]|uniref:Uncharacterized protein n=1 Tax=Agaricus bisporus var. burnettii (strain JB137-S8 / ATCC MYA-4627 / FGSC 10392) TaxID=597362 RepID=K5VWG2_AGABU|nr:uncharacterized protein AGABI1DRAFT_107287 [Agaricus bisporus var. burnettii JB137-S8]EKM78814.1 hypothetical protein AGABI1DRAFT_107287 [Agaricus bisporus var. burnettii JB137-S8]